MGYTNRTLKFYNKNHETLNLQRYKCNYCGKIFKATYWPFLISKASAKVACEGKLHNHIINSHYGNL